jgi:hypothetical protein
MVGFATLLYFHIGISVIFNSADSKIEAF